MQRVRGRVGVVEPPREFDGGIHPLDRAVRVPEQPEREPGRREAGDARVVAKPGAGDPWSRGLEQPDGRIEAPQTAREIAQEDRRGTDDQVPVDQHVRVVLGLRQLEHPVPEFQPLRRNRS